MNEKFLAFDLEFCEPTIYCAATMCSDEDLPHVWFDADARGISDSMSEATLRQFVEYLDIKAREGYTIVTWGGVGADFRLLASCVPSAANAIVQLCLGHVDIPFMSASTQGMMMGLASASAALGLCKPSSDQIPALWASPDRQRVLHHVSNDTFLTVEVVRSILKSKELSWITSRGIRRVWYPVSMLSVRHCLQLPLPVTPFQIQDSMNPKILSKWILEQNK
jgi:hypothetical protein